jgi:putative endonuclease
VDAETPQRRSRDPGGDGRPEENRRWAGRLGEELAAAHLEGLGYRLLARNVRTRQGEIDLIAFDGRTIAFVEVKTRRLNAFAGSRCPDQIPLAGLRQPQRARLRRLAAAWLSEQRTRPSARTIRFDAIGVILDVRGSLVEIEHLEGAW